MAENLYTPDCIRTRSGIYFNVFAPMPEMFNIEDIAHALSQIPRFMGHLPFHYSVAQHCVMGVHLIDPDHRYDFLMHEVSEAYLGDMPSPIKKRLEEYKRLEDEVMTAGAQVFGYKWPLSAEVKKMDQDMLHMEWDGLMLGDQMYPFPVWAPEIAKRRFMEQFRLLCPRPVEMFVRK